MFVGCCLLHVVSCVLFAALLRVVCLLMLWCRALCAVVHGCWWLLPVVVGCLLLLSFGGCCVLWMWLNIDSCWCAGLLAVLQVPRVVARCCLLLCIVCCVVCRSLVFVAVRCEL